MSNDILLKVDEYIQAIANSLGVAVEHVYEVLVFQSLLSGITQVIVTVILIGLFLYGILLLIRIYTKSKYEIVNNYHDKPINAYARIRESSFVKDGFSSVITAILVLSVLVLILFSIPSGVMKIINPEYYAIKEILSVFGE